jgi:hypothetical protein
VAAVCKTVVSTSPATGRSAAPVAQCRAGVRGLRTGMADMSAPYATLITDSPCAPIRQGGCRWMVWPCFRWFCGGAGVGRAWVPAWPANRLTRAGCPANRSAGRGPGSFGTHRRCRSDLPVLCKRPGFTDPGGQRVRAIPQPEKGTAMTIVEDARAITGGVDTHSGVHVAAAPGPVGELLGTREFPASAAATPAC